MTRHRTAAILAGALALATGCHSAPLGGPTPITVPPTSTTPTATPTPTPAPTTASATATPTPTQQQLFTQAVAQYTRTENEVFRVWKLGGLAPNEPPTAELKATTTGEPLDGYTATLRNLHDKQIINVSGEYKVHGAKLAPTTAGALVTIDVCVDGSSLRNTIGPEKTPGRGEPRRTIANYKMVDGQLKLFSGSDTKDDTCIAK